MSVTGIEPPSRIRSGSLWYTAYERVGWCERFARCVKTFIIYLCRSPACLEVPVVRVGNPRHARAKRINLHLVFAKQRFEFCFQELLHDLIHLFRCLVRDQAKGWMMSVQC